MDSKVQQPWTKCHWFQFETRKCLILVTVWNNLIWVKKYLFSVPSSPQTPQRRLISSLQVQAATYGSFRTRSCKQMQGKARQGKLHPKGWFYDIFFVPHCIGRNFPYWQQSRWLVATFKDLCLLCRSYKIKKIRGASVDLETNFSIVKIKCPLSVFDAIRKRRCIKYIASSVRKFFFASIT